MVVQSSMLPWHQRLTLDRHSVEVVAFAICSLALAIHLSDFLSFQFAETTAREIFHYTTPMAAIFLAFFAVKSMRHNLYIPLLIAGAFLAGTLIADISAVPRWLRMVVVAAVVVIMVARIRVGVIFYSTLSIAGGLIIGLRLGDPLFGLLGVASFALLLLATNYPIQMVLDHANERARVREYWRSLGVAKLLGISTLYWIPSAILVGGGLWFNHELQTVAVESIYESGWVQRAPGTQQSGRSEFERDVYYSIGEMEKKSKLKFEQDVRSGIREGTMVVGQVPDTVAKLFESVRPPPIDTGRACANMNLKAGKWKIGSAKGFCAGILRGAESWFLAWFERARLGAIGYTNLKVQQALKEGKSHEQAMLEGGTAGLSQLFEQMRSVAAATFAILLALSYTSYALLISALIGGYILVFGRFLFHFAPAEMSSPDQTTNPMAFRLDRTVDQATPLSVSVLDRINLRALGEKAKIKAWYVTFDAMRVGTGTHMRLCVPQWTSLWMQRLLTRRYMLTKVEIQSTEVKQASPSRVPRISLPGDLKLVCIEIDGTRDVIFHPRELLAFSDGVILNSIYSTHVAAHFFGLGSFYAAASGTGILVLISEGSQVGRVSRGLSVTPATLLAWDRRAEFRLAQERSFNGIWFNEPSLVALSPQGSSIIDEGRASATGLLSRLWRLVRYLLMPF